MKLLVLDFDGVISDSAPEAFVVALRTWADLAPESALRDAAATLAGPAAPSPRAIAAHPLYAGFVAHMPLGNRAEDYAVVLRALEHDAALPDQAAYDAFKGGISADWLRAYHRRFYQRRDELSAGDPAGWLRLLPPYPRFLELLQRRAGEVELAIATAKDRRSVGALLRHYGIGQLFAEDRVLDKEAGASKAAHLERLQRGTGTAYPEITFVDDKVNHLDAVAHLGVICGLAAWGYNGPRENQLARRRGYRVLAQGDVEEQLFDR